MSDFIKRLTVKNYGCLQDINVELTPLHAFVGPNDSGKSTLLRAVRTLAQFSSDMFYADPETKALQPFNPGDLASKVSLEMTHSDGFVYGLSRPQQDLIETLGTEAGKELLSAPRQLWDMLGLLRMQGHTLEGPAAAFAKKLTPARFVRLSADALRRPAGLIPEGGVLQFSNELGRGLPALYDVIINRHVEAFLTILKDVRRLFPSVARLGLNNASSSSKVMEVTLKDGKRVPAPWMSEGLLYYLAFAAIPYLGPAAVILVEEPENGLHPARIAEVVRILREVSKTTQVLLATHSPLVINEMKPEEVSVVTRPPEKGTQVTRIDRTPDFEDRAKVYALGELWISYADGNYEAPLLEGHEP